MEMRAPVRSMYPMVNVFDAVRSMPAARCFEVDDLLFAQFACPPQDRGVGLWSHTDHLVHVLTARSTWKTAGGTWSAAAGETLFFKKGAYVAPPHVEANLCLFVFFLPDGFVRSVVSQLAADLPPLKASAVTHEPAIRVNNDAAMTGFLHAMTDYFAAEPAPPRPLLRLKLQELVTGILVGERNRSLAAHLRATAASGSPAIPAIMEANFCHNLPLEAFARMSHRSLSTFKRDFRRHYGVSPGRWLLARRLERSATMLRSTNMSVTEVMLECGFEEASHFSRAFKEKHGCSPKTYRGVDANPPAVPAGSSR
jgi:AraC-like DNA-binding protein